MKSSRHFFLAAVVAGIPVLLTGCGGNAAIQVERADSAGVAVVTSHGEDRPLAWRFEERMRLGGTDEGPESFYELSRSLVATDAAGRIYVLDASAHRVVVFDSTGRHLATLGREGSGPGELEMPAGVAVHDGVVGVWDFGKSGLVRFDADGRPLAGFTSNAFYGGRGLQLRPGGAVFTTTDARDPAELREALVMLDTASEGETGWPGLNTVVSQPVPNAPMHRFTSCGLAMRLPPLFHPDVEWAPGPGGRLYVSDEVSYVVDVYADSVLQASYRRALDPRVATRALALAALGGGMTMSVGGGAPCTVPAEEVVEARGFADRIPFVEGLTVDPTGRVWVERVDIGDEPNRIDVLSADGAYLGTLTDAPVPIAFLPAGGLLAVETTELDVDQLVVYTVEGMPGD